VTFDPVPLYIICMRLGPSIPGVYVNPGFWTPKIRVLQVNTSQREQYGSTVHLFIGTGRNLCKITFMSFIFTTELWTTQRGLDDLFLFKSVPFSDVESKLLRP
jgi:hypothetical protein